MTDTMHIVLNQEDAQLFTEIRDSIDKLAQELRNLNPDGHLSDVCRRKGCSYYKHYLAMGPPDLTHDGFHAAEEICVKNQEQITRYVELNPDKPIPAELMDRADEGERRVRA